MMHNKRLQPDAAEPACRVLLCVYIAEANESCSCGAAEARAVMQLGGDVNIPDRATLQGLPCRGSWAASTGAAGRPCGR